MAEVLQREHKQKAVFQKTKKHRCVLTLLQWLILDFYLFHFSFLQLLFLNLRL